MSTIILLSIFVVVVIAILAILKAKSQGDGGADEVWPFYAKKPLSQPEQVLYFRLVQALPEHIVLAQVQLSRLLGVKKGNNYQAWFNRINRMSADFVVCNKDSSIVAVIELDDSTHQKEDRQAADAKKDKALSSAAIRIVRWQAKAIPDIATIQSTLMPNIAGKVERFGSDINIDICRSTQSEISGSDLNIDIGHYRGSGLDGLLPK